MNDAIRMQLSAFVDGELPENEAEMLLRRMSQDVELRQEVAEYMALSRFIRGEPGIVGADRLHERVVAEIDNRPHDIDHADGAVPLRAVRPMVGFAIAATVALLAIFVLQQTNGTGEADVADQATEQLVSVPEFSAQQERQRQYFLNHANASSQLGANGMNSRLVTLRFSEEFVEESDVEEELENIDSSDEAVTQP